MEVGFCWSVRQHRAVPQAQDGFVLPADSQESAPEHVKSLSPGAGDGFCLMTFKESSLIVPN